MAARRADERLTRPHARPGGDVQGDISGSCRDDIQTHHAEVWLASEPGETCLLRVARQGPYSARRQLSVLRTGARGTNTAGCTARGWRQNRGLSSGLVRILWPGHSLGWRAAAPTHQRVPQAGVEVGCLRRLRLGP